MSPFSRAMEACGFGEEAFGSCEDARSRRAGSYSAWLRKAKNEGAKAKWLCSTTKRYFTIDFDSQIFFYSHAEGAKKISHPIRFKEITGAEPLPESDKAAKKSKCGFLLRTRERTYELHTGSNSDASQWVQALDAAKDMGTAPLAGPRTVGQISNSSDSTTASSPGQPNEDRQKAGAFTYPGEEAAASLPPTSTGSTGSEDFRSRTPSPPQPSSPSPEPPELCAPAPPEAMNLPPAAQALALQPVGTGPLAPSAPAPVSELQPAAAPAPAAAEPAPAPEPTRALKEPAPVEPAAPAVAPSAAVQRVAAAVANSRIPVISSNMVAAPRLGPKPPVQEQDDAPGQYRIISSGPLKALPVSQDYARTSAKVGEVGVLQDVEVLEVSPQLDGGRRRARIADPAGWITVVDLNSGFRFAMKSAAEPSGQPSDRQAPAEPSKPSMPAPAPLAAPMPAPAAPMPAPVAPAATRNCPSGHQLSTTVTPGAGTCDSCAADVPAKIEIMECVECDYWLCSKCSDVQQAASSSAPKAEAPPEEPAPAAAAPAASEPAEVAPGVPKVKPVGLQPPPALRVTRAGVHRLPKLSTSPQKAAPAPERPTSALAGKRSESPCPSPGLKKTVSFDENEETCPIPARGEESPWSPSNDAAALVSAEAEAPSQAPLPPPPASGGAPAAPPPPPLEDAGGDSAALKITRPNVNVKRLPKLAGHLPRSPRSDAPLPVPAPAAPAPAEQTAAATLEPSGWDDEEQAATKEGPATQAEEPSGWDSDEEKKTGGSSGSSSKPQEQKMLIPEGPAVAMEIAAPSGFDSDDETQAKPMVTLARPASASKGGVALEFDMGGPKKAVPEALAKRLSQRRPAKRSGNKAGQRTDPTRAVDPRVKAALARKDSMEAPQADAAPAPPAPPVLAPLVGAPTPAPAPPAPAPEPPAAAELEQPAA